MSAPSAPPSLFGLSFGWSYVLASFTLTLTGCLPLALLWVMGTTAPGPERAQALMISLPVMAGFIAAACWALYATTVRHRPHWHRHVLLGMWGLSALGIAGWWTL